jgi:hypothetical protein
MSSRIIVANNPELIASEAAHFGVSVDNFISSAPAIGMEAFEIAHNGLVIVGPGNSFSRRELSTKQLFAGAYNTQGSPKIVSLNEDDDTVKAFVPEDVFEFCERRNIRPISVAKVGVKVLQFAMAEGAGIGIGLSVFARKTPTKLGALDSELLFSISPINMIIMERKKNSGAGLFRKLSRRSN